MRRKLQFFFVFSLFSHFFPLFECVVTLTIEAEKYFQMKCKKIRHKMKCKHLSTYHGYGFIPFALPSSILYGETKRNEMKSGCGTKVETKWMEGWMGVDVSNDVKFAQTWDIFHILDLVDHPQRLVGCSSGSMCYIACLLHAFNRSCDLHLHNP